jgi:hypothetical protein
LDLKDITSSGIRTDLNKCGSSLAEGFRYNLQGGNGCLGGILLTQEAKANAKRKVLGKAVLNDEYINF